MTMLSENPAATLHGADPDRRDLLVRSTTWEADDVMSLRLVDPDGGELPAWEPGAHIDLVLPSGLVRQYSLCGRPADRGCYTVAVLREAAGRGGSQELHETVLPGKTISVRGPRNRFPLVEAARYLFVAGGIGITPILAMVRDVSARGAEWRLVYGGRSRSSMAFVEELVELGEDRVEIVPQDELGIPDLDAALAQSGPGTAVYCCGPEGLLAAVERRCAEGPMSLHTERFGSTGAARAAEPVVVSQVTTFEVELRRSGCVVTVPSDRTILDAVRDVVPEAMSSCEEGYCGTCETRVIEGVPEHHDTILSDKERQAGKTMMICVGRSRTPRLVLDI
ncbi:PDR/VanB family oxidoreductase [Sphaerisporangium perillae]|uniref:PDR/VanB family oxidoreductase n=1 Tax=Sphaerisporangium perillae TaxID=2935860 RepID=UPI00200F32FD|nr:PDR/VanB family oxidoreductase [Sphaerisporangium perillae]